MNNLAMLHCFIFKYFLTFGDDFLYVEACNITSDAIRGSFLLFK